MNTALFILLAATMLLPLSGCLVITGPTAGTTTALPAYTTPPGGTATASEVTALVYSKVNQERAKLGLATLQWDTFLEGLAMEHSENMARLNSFSHDRFGWRQVNYEQRPGTVRGENLALTPVRRFRPGPLLTAEEIARWTIEGWLESPSHREMMLDRRLTHTGVAVVRTEEYFWITQDFEGPLD